MYVWIRMNDICFLKILIFISMFLSCKKYITQLFSIWKIIVFEGPDNKIHCRSEHTYDYFNTSIFIYIEMILLSFEKRLHPTWICKSLKDIFRILIVHIWLWCLFKETETMSILDDHEFQVRKTPDNSHLKLIL